MSIERMFSIVLAVTAAISNNVVHCTWNAVTSNPKTPGSVLPASSTHATLSAELLDVLKNFHSSLPGAGPQTTATKAAPPISDRVSIMHFPSGGDDEDRPSMAAPPHPSRGPATDGNALPVTVAPPAADPQSPAPITDNTHRGPSHVTDSAIVPIKAVSLSPKFNQDLMKMLADLRMSPAELHEPKGQGVPTHPVGAAETLPHSPSHGSPASAEPHAVPGPNQTPLDYLLSLPSPVINRLSQNSLLGSAVSGTDSNSPPPPPSPTATPVRLNLEFVKYLLTLPRYQQALNDLIKSHQSIGSNA